MNRFFLLAILLMVLPIISAETYPLGNDIHLTKAVRADGAIVDGIICNLTVISPPPNRTIIVDFQAMTDSTDYFNYTILSSNITNRGLYEYCITCYSPSGQNETGCYEFLVNIGGVDPSQQRSDMTQTAIYFLLAIALVMFLAFFFTQSPVIKWTFFAIFFLFLLISVNMIFMSLQDEVVNPRMENFFSTFTVISYYAYWFIGTLLAILWIITMLVTVLTGKATSRRERYGG